MKKNKVATSLLGVALLFAGGVGIYSVMNEDSSKAGTEVVTETKEVDKSKLSSEEKARLSAEATIPDKDFRAFLNQYLGKGSGNYNPITVGELESSTTDFIMSATTIYDITGIEHLKNVKRMNLSENAFKTMEPLAELTGLDSLVISVNDFDNIDFIKGMKNLRFLDVGYNGLENIEPIKELTELESLYMYQTLVTDLSPITGLPNLKDLYLQETPIKSVAPLEGMTSLKALGFYNTPNVEGLEVIGTLNNLEELALSQMDITDASMIKDLHNLKLLYLDGNKIKDISSLSDKILLEEVDISKNEVESIDSLKDAKNLEVLIASNNKIQSVDALKGKSKLLTLYLDNNQISDWSSLEGAFPDIGDFYADGNTKEPRQIEFYNGKPVISKSVSKEVSEPVVRITVSTANNGNSVQITDRKVIETIMSGLEKGQAMTEAVDLEEPEFKFNVLFSNGTVEGVNLWLGDKSDHNVGLITDDKDNSIVYTLPLEETDAIRDAILNALNN